MSVLSRLGKIAGAGGDVLVTVGSAGTVDTDFQEGDFSPGLGPTVHAVPRVAVGTARATGSLVSGVGHGVSDFGLWAGGMVKDVIAMPFDNFNVGNMLSSMYDRTKNRGGDLLNHTIGPNYGLGGVVKELPDAVTQGLPGDIWRGEMKGLATVSNEVSRDASTFLTALSLPISKEYQKRRGYDVKAHGQLFGLVFDKQTWRDARGVATGSKGPLADIKKADHPGSKGGMSPGQAIAALALTDDVYSDDDMLDAYNSPKFEHISGTLDAVYQFETGKYAGKATKSARANTYERLVNSGEKFQTAIKATKTTTTAASVNNFMKSSQFSRTSARIKERVAEAGPEQAKAVIRDEVFPHHPNGSGIADILVDAGKYGDETYDLSWRSLLGDEGAAMQLKDKQADLQGQIQRLTAKRNQALSWEEGTMFADPETVKLATSELEAAWRDTKLYDRMFGTMDDIGVGEGSLVGSLGSSLPNISGISSRVRIAAKRSEFYQASPLSRPLHQIFDMNPHHYVRFESQNSDVQVSRLLEQAGMDIGDKDYWRSSYINAKNASERSKVFQGAQEAALQSMFDRHGLSKEEGLRAMEEARSNLKDTYQQFEGLKSRAFSPEDKRYARIDVEDGSGALTQIHVPIWVTQEANVGVTLPFNKIEAQLRLYSKISKREKIAERIKAELGDYSDNAAANAKAQTRVGKLSREARLAANKATRKVPVIGRGATQTGIGAGFDELLSSFNKVWKPAVLIRGGWPIRVLMDEQARIFAKIGAMQHGMSLMREAESGAKHVGEDAKVLLDNLRIKTHNLVDRRNQLPLRERQRHLPFDNVDFSYAGYDFGKTYDLPGELGELYKAETDAGQAFQNIVRDAEGNALRQHRKLNNKWQTIDADHPQYSQNVESVINQQIAQDAIGRQILQGKTPEQVHEWLKSTPEGLRYSERNGWRTPAYIDENLVQMYEDIDRMLPHPYLRERALQRRLTTNDFRKAIGEDTSKWPAIHAGVTEEIFQGKAAKVFNGLVEKSYKYLGGLPTNILSRHPYFDARWRAHVKELTDLASDVGRRDLSFERIQEIKELARNKALHDVKDVLYDQAERSAIGEHLRYISPFYDAWKEVVTRWSGITWEKPQTLFYAQAIWQAPDKMGLVRDENGNVVFADGTAEDNFGNKVPNSEVGKERYISLPIPSWSKNLPLVGPGLKAAAGVDDKGRIEFNKRSFNMALQLPGVGPIVQLPANMVALARPDLAKSLKFILPYGAQPAPQGGLKDQLFGYVDYVAPAWFKRAEVAMDEDSDTFQKTAARMYLDYVTDVSTGKREKLSDDPKEEFILAQKEAMDKTKAFFHMRTVASFILPAAPRFNSPYQPYIDAYRGMQAAQRENEAVFGYEQDGTTPISADEQFVNVFGDEYFAITQSTTRNNTGVQPTIEAMELRRKDPRIKALIERFPEYGGLILGHEGEGEFSYTAYQSQFGRKKGPGSKENEREVMSLEQVHQSLEEKQGWYEFRRVMDQLEAQRSERNLPSFQVRGAQDLLAGKKAAVEYLKMTYPAWGSAYDSFDTGKTERTISDLRGIAFSDRMKNRSEMGSLREYIDVRDDILKQLSTRKAKSLEAKSNYDLMQGWEAARSYLVSPANASGLAFHDIFYRYLDNDTRLVGK